MKYLSIFLFLMMSFSFRAAHIVGGDIYYDYLGNNQYKFYITIYRDCFSTGAEYDNPLKLTVYTASGQLVQDVSVPFPGSVILPNNFNNPCANNPPNVCVEKAIYVVILTLPPTPGGYNVSYQRCCRGANVTNISNPGGTGLTLTAHVPGSETGFTANSSPRYTNYPPLILCSNEQLVFDHSATDPDGDQLVYSLVTPYAGASSATPAPNVAPPPPYSNVLWLGGFSAPQPLGPGSNVSINAATGVLTVNPNMIGLFVVGIRVQEYRNGVLIGQTVRDFLFKVFNCNIVLQAILPLQEDLPSFVSYCQGLTVPFVNNSYGGTTYAWDFGVAGTNTDVSTVFAPTFTFPADGTYQVRLIVNPGSACTDTAYQTIIVNNQIDVSFTSVDSLCFTNHSFNFDGTYTGSSGATFLYEFGPNANVSTANTLDVNNITFNSAGMHEIKLLATKGICTDSFAKTIYLFDPQQANFNFPSNIACNGLTVPFTNQSSDAIQYHWDFGVTNSTSDTSNLINPTFSFPSENSYQVSLIASSFGTCIDTVVKTVQVFEPLVMSFTHNDSLCVTNNSFNFDGTFTGSPTTQFTYNFGPNANPSSANNLDVNNVVYDTFGQFTISLTGTYGGNCSQTITDQVFVFREPSINFTKIPGLACVPYEATFIDLSLADSPILYQWTFGDGGTSTLQNPTHTYTSVGDYNVGLQIITTEGCKDTLFMMKQDFINVHPNPTSNFQLSPILTDICHSEITFTDLSTGADSIIYYFDDGYYGFGGNLVYTYKESGQHNPIQVAINQWGCSDTSRRNLGIEPFAIYIPNTFTPDGDEFNNRFIPKKALDTDAWELKIYNRWGELLFVSNDANIGWDGTYQNVLVPDGMYAYVLKYISCEFPEEWQQIVGHVNVLR